MFEVTYMAWQEFFKALESPREYGHVWEIFCQIDCIIGGVDMEVNYL